MKNFLFLLCAVFPACMFSQQVVGEAAGGEINYTCIGWTTYEFKIIMWGDSINTSDSLFIDFGDNTSRVLTASDVMTTYNLAAVLGANYQQYNEIIWECAHSYPSVGTYNVTADFIRRCAWISNIPNAFSTHISLNAQVIVDPVIGVNSSPVAVNNGYIFFPVISQSNFFTQNFNDPDGDSLSFTLIPCIASGYSYPDAIGGGILTVNNATGEFSWNAPVQQGTYNVGLRTVQWKHLANNSVISVGWVEEEVEFIVDNANAVAETNGDNSLSILPNPSSGNFTVQLKGATGLNPEIKIFNMFGQIVLEKKEENIFGNWQENFDLPGAADGIYFISVSTGKNKVTKKIIIQH